MKLTVLGSSAVRPNAGDACAGYLLWSDGRKHLIDCGPGIAGRLFEVTDLGQLDSVLLSHAHPDHCSDLVFLRQALLYAPDSGRSTDLALPVYAGRPAIETVNALGEVFGNGEPFWPPRIELRPIDSDSALELGSLTVHFAETAHYVPCLAMRFEANGASIVYGADSGPSAALERLARGANLLVLEATLPRRAGFEAQSGHLSAAEAGAIAARAGAKRLVLTHYFDYYDPEILRLAAAEECDVPVEIARSGRSWEV